MIDESVVRGVSQCLLESAAVRLLLYMYHVSFVQVLEECSSVGMPMMSRLLF